MTEHRINEFIFLDFNIILSATEKKQIKGGKKDFEYLNNKLNKLSLTYIKPCTQQL